MLKIKPPPYKFCPFCGRKLVNRKEERKTRKFCPFCRWTYYPHVGTAAGGIAVQKRKFLLVKRNRSPHKNTWMFPAGFVDYGEAPAETVVREMKEETGLRVEPVKLLAVIQSRDDPRSPGHFVFFYSVKVLGGKLQIFDREENAEIGWFPLDNLPPIAWQAHRLMVKKIKKGLGKRND